ncbi:VanW family protein [Cohnella terricola]|uniref:Uncharacterized protein n=1 Tax=Cohnella terricola TaxID=1289167 RepID=A0A559JPY5_9BACL|nr:VanW family protein [Cohnella terricola]TVY01939.1 hypothetical protein FPZ45_05700 [Cohnella terricola]
MIWKWMAGVILLAKQAVTPDNSLDVWPGNLTVTLEGQTIVDAKRTDYEFPLPGTPVVNDVRLKEMIQRLEKQVYRAPVDATLDGWGSIVPESAGYKLDSRAFADQFYGFMVEGGPTLIEVPRRVLYPRVDSELLTIIKEKVIGHYTTYYNSSNKNRSHNIDLASKAINNHYVFPGETFSFNAIVGERTVRKGYQMAKVIVRGEVSEGIGGGICQISSTLYNAVDRAGLKIVERYSHSRNVPYVPPGRDATVSWGGPDFIFQNQYDHPVLIRSYSGAGQTSIMIYSSDEIHNKPREVPSASKKLPEEVIADRNVHQIVP